MITSFRKAALPLVLLLSQVINSSATDYIFYNAGNYNEPARWADGFVPTLQSGDWVYFWNNCNIPSNMTIPAGVTFVVEFDSKIFRSAAPAVALTNNGTIILRDGGTLECDRLNLVNNGSITNSEPVGSNFFNGRLRVGASGNTTTVTNNGNITINIDGGYAGLIVNNGTFNNTSTGKLLVHGLAEFHQTNGNFVQSGIVGGGMLSISGRIRAMSGTSFLTTTTGNTRPGNSPGILSFQNMNLTQTGTYNVEVGGTNATQGDFDQIYVSGVYTMASPSVLNVSLVNGFTPSSGDSFKITNFASRVGTYSTVNLPNPAAWTVTYNSTNIIINYNGPLPVSLQGFWGKNLSCESLSDCAGNKNALSWKTSSEENFAYFEVERLDETFQAIGKIHAQGRGAEYTFLDAAPLSGINYYRLKMVDTDGSTAFSRVISVMNEAALVLRVFPNPVSDILRLEGVENEEIEILSSEGRHYWKGRVLNGSLSVEEFAPGTYLVTSGGKVTRFVKR